VSKTRLSVRNVPPEMDGKKLKAIFHDAVRRRATQANPKVGRCRLTLSNPS
jgi:nucleolar protein 4